MESQATDIQIKIARVEERLTSVEDDTELVKAELKNKVPYSVFTLVIGILLTIVAGILGVIYWRLEDIHKEQVGQGKTVSAFSSDISNMKEDFGDMKKFFEGFKTWKIEK